MIDTLFFDCACPKCEAWAMMRFETEHLGGLNNSYSMFDTIKFRGVNLMFIEFEVVGVCQNCGASLQGTAKIWKNFFDGVSNIREFHANNRC